MQTLIHNNEKYPIEYTYGFVLLCVVFILSSWMFWSGNYSRYQWIQGEYMSISFRVASSVYDRMGVGKIGRLQGHKRSYCQISRSSEAADLSLSVLNFESRDTIYFFILEDNDSVNPIFLDEVVAILIFDLFFLIVWPSFITYYRNTMWQKQIQGVIILLDIEKHATTYA